ncbi:MAG: DNA-binding protein [Gammaproteobacteria bacterium]|nr:DNA-binding protein [Gammaproteobacteria bacterium]
MAALPSDALVESLRLPGTASISPDKLAALLELPLQDLARFAGVHRNSLRLHPETPRAQAFARNVVRVLQIITDVRGDPDEARYLFKNAPIPTLGYKTALELVEEGRTEDVAGYLRSVSAGFVG